MIGNIGAAFLILSIGLGSTQLHAQSLRTATVVFSVVAASDIATTQYGIERGSIVESNPLLSHWQSQPMIMSMVAMSADMAGVTLWNRFMGRRHPKVAVIGLYAMTGVRAYFLSKGLRYIHAR